MKIIKKEDINIDFICQEIIKDKIFIMPTDTSYGIVTKVSPQTIERIFKIKKRPKDKSIPIFVNKKIVENIALVNKKVKIFIKKFWPGALTLVLRIKPEKISFLRPVLGPNNTIAVREPNHQLVLEILKKYKKPLTATSANISSNPPAYKSREILSYFSGIFSPDYFIDFGNLPINPVSTIIDVSNNNLKLLREGKIKEKAIKEF